MKGDNIFDFGFWIGGERRPNFAEQGAPNFCLDVPAERVKLVVHDPHQFSVEVICHET